MANTPKHTQHLFRLVSPLFFLTIFTQKTKHSYRRGENASLTPAITQLLMAAFSSSSYISNLVKIRRETHHAMRLRWLPPPPRIAGTSFDPGFRRRPFSGIKSAANLAPSWDSWKPDQATKTPSLSDILWPSAGAFAAMAVLGKMDQILAKKGVSMTIAPLGAVCAVLFATPSTPGARKYNMFMAQMGCAAIGVLAFSLLGPGWLARSTALSASLAFMIYFRAIHPPAASLPLLFIDGAKFHHLKFWYVLFPGAAGCLLLCLIQEAVCYLKDNVKF